LAILLIGGLPLKILWAVFDLLTIIVLASGLKLWMGGRRLASRRRAKLDQKTLTPTR